MSTRTLNFTGRKKIRRSDVQVTVTTQESPAAFTANLDLSGYKLPANAAVYVEAYRQAGYMRFAFGVVQRVQPPKDTSLAEFDAPEGVLFRVKVVSTGRTPGLLLAEADRIRPRLMGGQQQPPSLLPVQPADLGEEVWRLDLDAEEPVLLVNRRLGDWRATARHPVFAALVFPEVYAQVLTRLADDDRLTPDDDAEDWYAQWLRQALSIPGVGRPPAERELMQEWVRNAVGAFCRQHAFLKLFTDWLEEGS